MKNRLMVSALVVAAVVLATPALAKKPAKKLGGIWSGLYCAQGADNVFIPKATLPAKYKNSVRKGQKAKINIAGYGPVWCVAY
jgi:hypothetical protein